MTGPLQDLDEIGGPDHLAGDPIYDLSDDGSFNLYFKPLLGNKIVVATIIPPIISPASVTSQVLNSPPVEERRREYVVPKMPPFASEEWESRGISFRDGLCDMTYKTRRGFEHCLCSYEDLFRGDWEGTLRIPVMEKEGGDTPSTRWGSEVSIDEASGRVIIWVGNRDGGTAGKCFIGDLV